MASNRIFNITRMLHQKETFMAEAFRGEAVVPLLRTSNNVGQGCLLLTRRVKIFMLFCQITVCKVLPVKSNTNQFTALNIIVKMKLHKIFMKYSG